MFNVGKMLKEGFIKLLGEELTYDASLQEQFAQRWEARKLEKRIEALEAKLNVTVEEDDKLVARGSRF